MDYDKTERDDKLRENISIKKGKKKESEPKSKTPALGLKMRQVAPNGWIKTWAEKDYILERENTIILAESEAITLLTRL